MPMGSIQRNVRSLFDNIPTENKDIPADAKRDLKIALITLKYTQSNSVCYVKDGAAVFILAASPGYCDLYYKEVTIEIIDGTSRLVKIYGKYHIIYFFYL